MRVVSLEDALKLVCLYAEKGSPKFERAAMKWLRRYLEEKTPTLGDFAKVMRSLEQRGLTRSAREPAGAVVQGLWRRVKLAAPATA